MYPSRKLKLKSIFVVACLYFNRVCGIQVFLLRKKHWLTLLRWACSVFPLHISQGEGRPKICFITYQSRLEYYPIYHHNQTEEERKNSEIFDLFIYWQKVCHTLKFKGLTIWLMKGYIAAFQNLKFKSI